MSRSSVVGALHTMKAFTHSAYRFENDLVKVLRDFAELNNLTADDILDKTAMVRNEFIFKKSF